MNPPHSLQPKEAQDEYVRRLQVVVYYLEGGPAVFPSDDSTGAVTEASAARIWVGTVTFYITTVCETQN